LTQNSTSKSQDNSHSEQEEPAAARESHSQLTKAKTEPIAGEASDKDEYSNTTGLAYMSKNKEKYTQESNN
jgi:hypothetical protein